MTKWKEFEEAVTKFISAFSPEAKVTHDVRLPDRDSGEPRQHDVWIETKICRMYPVKVLVSCKRLKRKLNQQDIDAFSGELRSSSAHLGVIYSYSGFTAPAIKKAKVLNICCCRLYQNEPPDIPNILFISFYCCALTLRLQINSVSLKDWGDKKFSEVFQITYQDGTNVLDYLESEFHKSEQKAVKEVYTDKDLSKTWDTTIKVLDYNKQEVVPLYLKLIGRWRIYRAKLKAHLVQGTYSFTDDSFFGSLSTPFTDLREPEIGPGWERLSEPPDISKSNFGIIFLMGSDVKSALQHKFGNKIIKNEI